DPCAFAIPSSRAASFAFCKLLEAIAVTSLHSPFCMPGITFRVAIDATPSTPHFTLFTCAMGYSPQCRLPPLAKLATLLNFCQAHKLILVASREVQNMTPTPAGKRELPPAEPTHLANLVNYQDEIGQMRGFGGRKFAS